MSSAPATLDSAAKFWLFFLVATALAGGGLLIYRLFPDHSHQKNSRSLAPAVLKAEPTAQSVDSSGPTTWSPDSSLPESFFTPTITPEVQAAQQKALINAQADYLLDLRAKYPKTASLATPEQIEEMRKSGQIAH